MTAPRPLRTTAPMTLKGLIDVKTTAAALSGSSGGLPAHKLHMRLCALEMERYRREHERRIALERADKCTQRCDAIEAEVRALLNVMNRRAQNAAGVAGFSPTVMPPHAQTTSVFTHRY